MAKATRTKASRRASANAVARAADRAEARSDGKPMPEAVPAPLDPPSAKAAEIVEAVKRGRPSKYRAEFAKQAKKLCELGATDYDLAEFFGVDTTTIWRWRSEHKAFCDALTVGKGEPDDRVERSLYQRAVGYSFNSTKFHAVNGEVTQTPCVEHVPPDPAAAKMWLTNRRGDEWRSKQELSISTLTHEEALEQLE